MLSYFRLLLRPHHTVQYCSSNPYSLTGSFLDIIRKFHKTNSVSLAKYRSITTMLVTTSMANFLLGVLAGVSAQAGSDDTLDIPGPAKFHTIHLGVKVLENDLTPSIQGYQLAYDLTSYCNANITIVPVGNSSSHGDAGAVFYTINTTAGVTGFLDSETGNAALTIEGFSFPFDSFPQIGFVRATCEDTNVSTPGFSTVCLVPIYPCSRHGRLCRQHGRFKGPIALCPRLTTFLACVVSDHHNLGQRDYGRSHTFTHSRRSLDGMQGTIPPQHFRWFDER